MVRRLPALATAAIVAGATLTLEADPGCGGCLWARFWTIPSTEWNATAATPQFPEGIPWGDRPETSFGIAFSGGGTRSAAATAGQLRGLTQNGWLDKAHYITGVSGGSWSVVPYTYSTTPLGKLLGPMVEPGKLDLQTVNGEPEGLLLASVVHSRLATSGIAEGLEFIARKKAGDKRVAGFEIADLLDRVFGTRGAADQTYADMLGRAFIEPHLPGGAHALYSWNDASVAAIVRDNPTLASSDFKTAAPHRPFPIVGGSIIYQHPAYDYPRLVPVEYTPLYSGVRQQFGGRIGGSYVQPFAYDVDAADAIDGNRVRVIRRQGDRRFTLADAIASSGAAPLLGLVRGKPLAAIRFGATFFPSWNHFAIRPGPGGLLLAAPPALALSHGDGGFTDNLGLMPLLARQVKNIILFVNSMNPFEPSLELQSLFRPLDRREDWGGDRSGNTVFDASLWPRLRDGLTAAVAENRAAVFCDRGWSVKENELYNIHGYEGLNICFVYNQRIPSWEELLPKDTQAEIAKAKRFRNFPWFQTFTEVKLDSAQATLLAALSSWVISNPDIVRTVSCGLRDALPAAGPCPGSK